MLRDCLPPKNRRPRGCLSPLAADGHCDGGPMKPKPAWHASAMGRWLAMFAALPPSMAFTVQPGLAYQPSVYRVTRVPAAQSSATDYIAGFFASAISTTAVYPIETFKVRLQSGDPFSWSSGESPFSLLNGIELGLAKECPNAAIYLGAYAFLRDRALASPFIAGHDSDPAVVFSVALVCGALGDAAGSPLRLPFELVGKNVQAGRSAEGASFSQLLGEVLPEKDRTAFALQTWVAILARDMPFGALQLCFYELAKLAIGPSLGDESFSAHLIEGALAGGVTAIVTTPIDCSVTRLMLVTSDDTDRVSRAAVQGARSARSVDDIWDAVAAVWEEEGAIGFMRGWSARALQFAPAAMIFFASYETIRALLLPS